MRVEKIRNYIYDTTYINDTKTSSVNISYNDKYFSNIFTYPINFSAAVMPSIIPFYDKAPETTITDILPNNTIFNDFLLYSTQQDMATQIISSNSDFIEQNFIGNDSELARFGVIVLKYKKAGRKEYSNLLSKLNTHNIRNIAEQYGELYDSTIKPMQDVAKGKVQYSAFWVEEKKLGERNLADLLLENLSYTKAEISDMSSSKKADIINTSLQKRNKFQNFYTIILEHWLSDIFKEKGTNSGYSVKTQEKENYDDIKVLFHRLKQAKENAFIEFVESDTIDNKKIGEAKIIDIMLEAIQDDDENYVDKNTAFKKKALLAYAEFPDMREKAINAVLKKIVKAELKSESESNKIVIPDNIKTYKLKPEIIYQLYSFKSQHDANEIIKKLKLFGDDHKQSFLCLIPQNPLVSNSYNFGNNNEKYSLIFSLLQDALNTAPDDTAKNIIELLNAFSSAYKQIENNIQPNINTEKLWQQIINIAISQWENKYLPQILNNRLQAIIDIDRLKKDSFKIEDETIYSIKEILKSNDYTPEQQAFLLKRSVQDGYDFRRFVTQDKPNVYLRKEFINALMQKENNLDSDFKLFQEDFINSVRMQDIGHYLNLQTPDGNLLNILAQHLNLKYISLVELTQKLNKLSDDELNLLTNKVKSSYFEMKRKSDFISETNKYDFALELDKQLTQKADSILINIDGQAITLKEAMTTQYDSVINKLGVIDDNIADIKVSVDKVLNEVLDINASLEENLKRIETIEATLTVLEKRFPERAKDIQKTKTFWQKCGEKLKSLCTPKGLLKAGCATLAATLVATGVGAPLGATLVSALGLTGTTATTVTAVTTIAAAKLGGIAGSSIV